MSNLLLMLIVFIEGFASLGDEVIALRRLMPHVGNSITVTVPTIGLFLAALALGYWSGGRIQDRFLVRGSRNFLDRGALKERKILHVKRCMFEGGASRLEFA